MNRVFDIIFSVLGILFLFPLLLAVYLIKTLETDSPFFFQVRVGKDKKNFVLVKFRTMTAGTKSIPSHMINDESITRIGKFLRKTKIDELPQLWNVLKGEMSIVGRHTCRAEIVTLRYIQK